MGEGHGGVGHLLRAFGVWLRGPGQPQRHEAECSLSAHPLGAEHLLTRQGLAQGFPPSFGVLKALEVPRAFRGLQATNLQRSGKKGRSKGHWLGEGPLVTSCWVQWGRTGGRPLSPLPQHPVAQAQGRLLACADVAGQVGMESRPAVTRRHSHLQQQL